MPRKVSKRKRRAVIDTSVLIAGISGFKETMVPGKNRSADLLRRWTEQGNFVWLLSEDILEEYKEILTRLHVRPHIIGRIVNLLRERAEVVKIRRGPAISPDPDDDPFCMCAEQGEADLIVTLNPKDFPQGRLTARVISPNAIG